MRAFLLAVLASTASCTGDPTAGSEATGRSTTSGDSDSATGTEPSTSGVQSCGAGMDAFSEEALAADIVYLASDELGGRRPGTPGDEATLALIDERFRCLGLTPADAGDDHRQPFVTSQGDETANVIGILPGGDPQLASEVIVIGAHHDHLGTKGEKIFNGANDNASGVAAVLAIARSMSERGVVPRRTIAFVTFGYEEHDGKCEGSEHLVANPPAAIPIDDVVYLFDLDMVGTYPSEGVLTAYGSLEGTPGRGLLEARMSDYPDLGVDLGFAPEVDDSDFQAFCDVGIPFLYFETWDQECYHRPCDDEAKIDYPSLSAIVKLSADVLLDLANTDGDLRSLPADIGCP